MTHTIIIPLTLAAASGAPFWIAGWIIILAVAIGVGFYSVRKRRHRR
jgi:hypothetical protein